MNSSTERFFTLKKMRIRLHANFPGIVQDDEYFLGKGAGLHSLLSNFHSLEPLDAVEDSRAADVDFEILDTGDSPLVLTSDRRQHQHRYLISGPARRLEKEHDDKRSAICGNMGLFSKVLAGELEERGIFSFHSTSFVNPADGRLYLVLGGSGAGKSTVLLKALLEGMQIFGTELTHVEFRSGKPVFLKGSLWQNCRMGNLVEDFPPLLEKFAITDLPEGNPWHQYRSIDLRPWQYPGDEMDNPEVVILFPRIESNRLVPERYRMRKEKTAYSIYQNLSDKISPPSYLYGCSFIPSIDSGEAQIRRMAAAERFLEETRITAVWKALTRPDECLEGIFEN